MNFLQSVPARIITLIISICLFAYLVNENITNTGSISLLTWLFGGVVILNSFNLYVAWKKTKNDNL